LICGRRIFLRQSGQLSRRFIATRHLLEQGRKRIALLGHSQRHYSIRQRTEGYQQALFDAGISLPGL
jgi:DNA-binding LacI/PurR family transcriptional regulator